MGKPPEKLSWADRVRKNSEHLKAWADRVKVQEKSSSFTLEPIKTKSGFHMPDDAIDDDYTEWRKCIFGVFPGYKMPFHAARSIATRAWGSLGLVDVRSTATGFLIFRFHSEDEVLQVLERGPWSFGGKMIVLQQWCPALTINDTEIEELPVWIRLYDVPFHLWTPTGLSHIAGAVGTPLFCDKATQDLSRLDYARICVKINAAEERVNEIEFTDKLSTKPYKVEVEYEWRPKQCLKCGIFGHKCKDDKAETELSADATSSAPVTAAAPPPEVQPIIPPATTSGPTSASHPAPSQDAPPTPVPVKAPAIEPHTLPPSERQVTIIPTSGSQVPTGICVTNLEASPPSLGKGSVTPALSVTPIATLPGSSEPPDSSDSDFPPLNKNQKKKKGKNKTARKESFS